MNQHLIKTKCGHFVNPAHVVSVCFNDDTGVMVLSTSDGNTHTCDPDTMVFGTRGQVRVLTAIDRLAQKAALND